MYIERKGTSCTLCVCVLCAHAPKLQQKRANEAPLIRMQAKWRTATIVAKLSSAKTISEALCNSDNKDNMKNDTTTINLYVLGKN